MPTWYEADTWIVVIAVLCAVSCSLLGNFLVLRQMSMMGDAISHAVLPGLAVAFIVTGSRSSVTMFVGAGVVGVLTALFTQWVHQFGRVDRGAAMGVVFTTLFALGLILLRQAADHVDLDPGCVLYGSIELAPLDVVEVSGWVVPRPALVLGGVLVLNLLFVVVFFKELRISSFDPGLATSLGINAGLMHYLLMTLVAVTTVAAFESIGSILVIAMLIVPAATAHLLTDRLGWMVVVSAVVAAGSAAIGHAGAITVPGWFGFRDTTTSGMMAASAGGLFCTAALFAPRHGLVGRAANRASVALKVLQEDVLGLLYRLEEMAGTQPDGAVMEGRSVREALAAGAVASRVALYTLARGGQVAPSGAGYTLTPAGRDRARDLVRSHRLWESYLVRYLNLRTDHVHGSAMRLEHVTDPRMQELLELRTEQPVKDPQGKPIPRGEG